MSVITKTRPTSAIMPHWPHPNCFVCSETNKQGLNLEFTPSDDGGVCSIFCGSETFEGYPGVLHGGIVSSIVDGAMTNCLFAQNIVAVTAELNVRFRSPVVTGRKTIVKAKIIRNDSPLFVVEARIIQDAKIRVTATGKFLEKPNIFGNSTL
jgi:uncharacterized protein (TIGR00369 family)